MAGNNEFQLVQARGWTGGLNNLMRVEFGRWFGTRLWLWQALMWTLIIDGVLIGILFSEASVPTSEALMIYGIMGGMMPAIAVVIIMQDVLVGEKESGTAAWVLSKPASRSAFVLSKWAAALVGVLVAIVVIPGIGAFILINIAHPGSLQVGRFALGLGAIWINAAYYLTLTLMLGAFFSNRAGVIGIPLALAFGQQFLFSLLPALAYVLPWPIVAPVGNSTNTIFSALVLGQTPTSWLPLIVTFVCIPIFLGLGLWRFEREEL
jgi:ABC-2 type transport system permease protein